MIWLTSECLRCLYFEGLESREEAIGKPLEGTFSWIWDKDQCDFLHWLEKGRGLYWISGRASSGKSTLMKYIVNTSSMNAKKHLGTEKRLVVVSYFIDGKSQHPIAPTLEGIARAFLWRLLREDASFFDFVLPHLQEMKRSRPTLEWKPSVLQEILVKILSQRHCCSLWFFLDGLDEYPGDLLDIADVCNKLAEIASKSVRICVSSRPEQEIACSISPTVNAQNSVLKLEEHTRADITILATQEISRLSSLLDSPSRTKLIENLSTRANGLFMWVKLASRDIVRSCMKGVGADTDRLLGRLDRLPEEVTQLYLQVLQKRTEQPDQNEGLLMLGVVAFGKRSFSLREFSFILHSAASSIRDAELDSLRRKIDSVTGGLLDYRTGRVVFSHETVSSFVHNLLRQETDSIPLIEGSRRLSEACLLLLQSFEQPKVAKQHHRSTLSDNDGYRLQELRSYSVRHWLHHLISSATQGAFRSMAPKCLSVKNQEIAHWHRIYLARCWEHPALVQKSCHPMTTTLAFLLLSAIPLSIFSSEEEIGEPEADPFKSLLRNPEEWYRHDLDFLVSIEFSPGYSVSFHAGQMLKTRLGNVLCIVDCPKGKCQPRKTGEQNDWIQLLLKSSSSIEAFENPVRFSRCRSSDFNEVPIPKRELYIKQSFLNQIKVVLWHCIQMETARDPEATHEGSSQNDNNELRFVTPLHYAAFNGLDTVIVELHKCGANVKYVSKESCYGTPLIAAIWGLNERRYATLKNTAIETLLRLDRTRQSVDLPGNSAHLGTVTPLNAAVKLYTGYRRRVGIGSEDLMEVIRLFIDEGAQIDPATRAIARSSPELRRYFADTSRTIFSSWASQYSPTLPIPIPSPRNFSKSPGDPLNASIADLGPSGTMSSRAPRLVQTVDERFIA